MSRNYPVTIEVAQPCHEQWSQMVPAAESGRHCAACQTVVVDFTRMTDAEIMAFLSQRPNVACGRFASTQLNRPLRGVAPPAPRWRTWLAATAAVLGLREIAAEQSHSQQPATAKHNLPTRNERKATTPPQHNQAPPDTARHIVRGRVIDRSSGDGLPGVTVLLKNTTTGISTGPDGSFELTFPESVSPSQLLMFSYIGYVTEERRLDSFDTRGGIVLLPLDPHVMGLLVAAGNRKPYPWHSRSLWNWARRGFQR